MDRKAATRVDEDTDCVREEFSSGMNENRHLIRFDVEYERKGIKMHFGHLKLRVLNHETESFIIYEYQALSFSFCQNSPTSPFNCPSASMTGVFAPSSGVFFPSPFVKSVLTKPGQQETM